MKLSWKLGIEFFTEWDYIIPVTICSYFFGASAMAIDRVEFLSVLEDSYSAYYNIIRDGIPSDYPLIFRADYFQRGERFWLSKSIPIYGNETNEFCYVFSSDAFGLDDVRRCIDFALEDGLPRVKPHKEHQYSNIKTVFVADSFSDEAVSEIRSRRFQKSYNHSFWGYSSLLTTAVDVAGQNVWVNREGRDMKKYIKKLFSAQRA